jgi:hypothetical protein
MRGISTAVDLFIAAKSLIKPLPFGTLPPLFQRGEYDSLTKAGGTP